MARNGQDQLHKNKTCQVNVIFSSDSIPGLVVQQESGAAMDLDYYFRCCPVQCSHKHSRGNKN